MIQGDFNIVFLFLGLGGWVGGGEIFVIAGALKSFILKLPILTSIFFKQFTVGPKHPSNVA